jgi:hypothetical protein
MIYLMMQVDSGDLVEVDYNNNCITDLKGIFTANKDQELVPLSEVLLHGFILIGEV